MNMKYFHELFDRCVADHPANTFLYNTNGTMTFYDLDTVVNKITKELQFFNLPTKARIIVVGENCSDYVAAILAVSRVNGVFCGFNARQTAFELEQYIQKFDPHLVVFVESGSNNSRQLANKFGATDSIIPGFKMLQRQSTKMPLPEHVAAVIFSSGTTGEPKGIMVSHRGIIQGAKSTAATRGIVNQDRLYACIPMTHSFGLSSILCGALLVGAGIIIRSKFDPIDVVDCLKNQGLTALQGPPTLFAKLIDWMEQQGIKKAVAPDLRYLYTGSAPLTQTLKNKVENMFGIALNYGYAVSEYPPGVAVTKIGEQRTDLSVGYVTENIKLKIINNGKTVEQDEVGNIWISGPLLTPGYLDDPDLTSCVVVDGWLNTGDLGYFDKQGALFIVSREKEVIKHSGFSVFPAEIENLLNSLPDVDSSAVIGKPSTNGDEEILAFVKMKHGADFDLVCLKQYLQEHLAPYKQPQQIKQIQEFPLTVSNKIIKRKLYDSIC